MLSRSLCLLLVVCAAGVVRADEPAVERQLAAIARVGPQGQHAAEARQACDALVAQSPEFLPRLLVAMDTPNVIVANWYRTVYDAIVERELAKATPRFPLDELKQYVADPVRHGRARRLALELVDRLEPEFGRQLLPKLLDDPEFRSEAVDLALAAAGKAQQAGDKAAALAEFRRAYEHAREGGQITTAAQKLQALGEKVDVPRHMGFVTAWMLIGPFDAPGTSGFDLVLPPEKAVDLQARYKMQNGTEHGWQPHRTPHTLGESNLIDVWGHVREAVAYAYAELASPREQAAEIRCSADDNCTVWLNGEKVIAKRQWLNGTRLDRFRAAVTLRQGTNRLLVKICQGPQHRDPEVPNNWTFQLRFCDACGAGLALEPVLAIDPEAAARKGAKAP